MFSNVIQEEQKMAVFRQTSKLVNQACKLCSFNILQYYVFITLKLSFVMNFMAHLKHLDTYQQLKSPNNPPYLCRCLPAPASLQPS